MSKKRAWRQPEVQVRHDRDRSLVESVRDGGLCALVWGWGKRGIGNLKCDETSQVILVDCEWPGDLESHVFLKRIMCREMEWQNQRRDLQGVNTPTKSRDDSHAWVDDT